MGVVKKAVATSTPQTFFYEGLSQARAFGHLCSSNATTAGNDMGDSNDLSPPWLLVIRVQ